MLPFEAMNPPLEQLQASGAAESRSDAELAAATARLQALGIDDEVVFSGTADEVIAFLEADDPCALSG